MHPSTPEASTPLDPEVLEAEAERQFEAGNLKVAQSLQEASLALFARMGCPDREARSAQSLGYLTFRLHDHPGARRAYARAARLKEELGDLRGAAVAIARLAESHQSCGEHREALERFEHALALLRRSGHVRDIGTVLNNVAVSHRELGRCDEAMHCHTRALEIRRAESDYEGLAASLHNIGVLHGDAGRYRQAHEALDEAMQLRMSLGDRPGLGRTTLRAGILHEEQGHLQQAVNCYEQARQLARHPTGAHVDDEAAALCNLGGLLIAQGEPRLALPLLQDAHAMASRHTMNEGLGSVAYTLGLAHAALSQTAEAFAAFSDAVSIQTRRADHRALAVTYAALGVLCARSGQYDQAETWLLDAQQMEGANGDPGTCAAVANLLGEIDQLRDKPDSARKHFERAAKLKLALTRADPQGCTSALNSLLGPTLLAGSATEQAARTLH